MGIKSEYIQEKDPLPKKASKNKLDVLCFKKKEYNKKTALKDKKGMNYVNRCKKFPIFLSFVKIG